jgi:uncharacterized protein (DUF433 family)
MATTAPVKAPCTLRPGLDPGWGGVGKSATLRYAIVVELLDRITHSPAVMGGRPCIRGMRVTVGTIMGLLASGRSQSEILAAYPYLQPEDVQAALAYAAWRAKETDLPLT